MARSTVGVALKWIDLRHEVDPLTGDIVDDGHSVGCSPADRAALEWALRLGAAWNADVVVATVGPPAADALLRDAIATGADRAVRVAVEAEGPDAPPLASEDVAVALAAVFADVDVVCCGDVSLDRGSGSVPAYLAARLGAAQALGLVGLDPSDAPGRLQATRRLDQGRREVLAITAPAVVSVEGNSAELRRAGLGAVLAARDHAVELVTPPAPRPSRARVVRRAPYRPRAQVLAAPSPELNVRDRILSLTGALVDRTPPRTVTATTEEAAGLVLDQLRTWGYLP